MLKRKQITDNTWMIFEDMKPFGFLREFDNQLELMVGAEHFVFANQTELEAQIGILVDIRIERKEQIDIKGFPSRHVGAIPVDHPTLPAYRVSGNTVFVAGYFALKFASAKAWQVVHSPKLATVEANNLIGPFKTRIEALNESNAQTKRMDSKYD